MSVSKLVSRTGHVSYVAIVNVTVAGKRTQVRRRVATRAEAKRIEAEITRQRDAGPVSARDQMTVASYLDQWAERDRGWRPSTVARIRAHIDHLARELGPITLSRLTPLDVAGANDRLRARGLASRTILATNRVLRQALTEAVKLDLVIRNVADLVDPPRAAPFAPHLLTRDELRAVFAAADLTPIGPVVRIGALTGLRLGEALGITWGDVDLGAGTLTVARAVNAAGSVSLPKTRSGRRTISLSPDAVSVFAFLEPSRGIVEGASFNSKVTALGIVSRRLKPLTGSVEAPTGTGAVFPLSQSMVRHHWLTIKKASGVNARYHDLRHAHASYLLAAGVPVTAVAARLGHSSPQTTLTVYSHVIPGADAGIAEIVDKAMGG